MRTQEITTKFDHPLEVQINDTNYTGFILIEYNVFMELNRGNIEVFAAPFNIENVELIQPEHSINFGVKVDFDTYITANHRDIINKLARYSFCLSQDKKRDEMYMIPNVIEIFVDDNEIYTYDQ